VKGPILGTRPRNTPRLATSCGRRGLFSGTLKRSSRGLLRLIELFGLVDHAPASISRGHNWRARRNGPPLARRRSMIRSIAAFGNPPDSAPWEASETAWSWGIGYDRPFDALRMRQ